MLVNPQPTLVNTKITLEKTVIEGDFWYTIIMYNTSSSTSPILNFFKGILIYLLAIYIFIILGRAIWANWNLKKEIDQIKQENIALEEKNHNLQNLIVYYQSDSFKELEARDKLGLKAPDEKVVIVPITKISSDDSSGAVPSADQKQNLDHGSNWQAWWAYIFS